MWEGTLRAGLVVWLKPGPQAKELSPRNKYCATRWASRSLQTSARGPCAGRGSWDLAWSSSHRGRPRGVSPTAATPTLVPVSALGTPSKPETKDWERVARSLCFIVGQPEATAARCPQPVHTARRPRPGRPRLDPAARQDLSVQVEGGVSRARWGCCRPDCPRPPAPRSP